jgi:hypothetical protein
MPGEAMFRTRGYLPCSVLAASAVTAAALLSVPPAGATAVGPEVSGGGSYQLSPDELTDLQRMAEEDGTSLTEAIDSFGWQNDFAIFATAMEEQYANDFAGARIENADRQEASIAFKGEVPAGAADQIANFRGAHVEIEDGRDHSLSQLDERLETVHMAVARRKDLVEAAISSYDLETGGISVEVEPTDPSVAADASRSESLTRALRAELPAAARGWPVAIAVKESVSAGYEAVYGGGRLEFSGTGSLACTTGFTVRNSGGTTGFATAGHCGENLTYESYSGASESSTYRQREHRGSYGDLQWDTVAGTEVDNFYYSFGNVRDVAAIANPVDGQRVCRFGHNQGTDCAYVQDLSFCLSYEGYNHCRLVRMDRDTAGGGDSGGPWYYGNTAYGIHGGQIDTWLGTRDFWSRVTYLDEALGVTVLR